MILPIGMSFSPHIPSSSVDFPGDPSDQPPLGLMDSLRSLLLWPIGVSQLALWSLIFRAAAQLTDVKKLDRLAKTMSRIIPAACGIKVDVQGKDRIDPRRAYVYVINHVNIFDMFVIYQAIPHFSRALEHVDHFSWPIIGPFLTAAGQIPVDPRNRKLTARALKDAGEMLTKGDSITVLPEGERTLDGSVGHFYPGAFRLAISANVPVVPMAMRGARNVSRRGDWRIRPGKISIEILDPISTDGLVRDDALELARKSREAIIAALGS